MQHETYEALVKSCFQEIKEGKPVPLSRSAVKKTIHLLEKVAQIPLERANKFTCQDLNFIASLTPSITECEASQIPDKARKRTEWLTSSMSRLEEIIEGTQVRNISIAAIDEVFKMYVGEETLRERLQVVARKRLAEIDRRAREDALMTVREHSDGSTPLGSSTIVINPMSITIGTDENYPLEFNPEAPEDTAAGTRMGTQQVIDEEDQGASGNLEFPEFNPIWPVAGEDTEEGAQGAGSIVPQGTGAIRKQPLQEQEPIFDPEQGQRRPCPPTTSVNPDGTLSQVPSQLAGAFEWLHGTGHNITEFERLSMSLTYYALGRLSQLESALAGLAIQVKDLSVVQQTTSETVANYVTGITEATNRVGDMSKRIETMSNEVIAMQNTLSVISPQPTAPARVPNPPVTTTHPDARLQGAAASKKQDTGSLCDLIKFFQKHNPSLAPVHLDALSALLAMANPCEIKQYTKDLDLNIPDNIIEYLATSNFTKKSPLLNEFNKIILSWRPPYKQQPLKKQEFHIPPTIHRTDCASGGFATSLFRKESVSFNPYLDN